MQRWVASGSFDRTIKLWDLHGGSPTSPLVTLSAPESSGPKASIYAITTDPYGSIVASGSPERVIRMWDPRSGKRVGKLVGHTDNIRAMLLSEDAKYVSSYVFNAPIVLSVRSFSQGLQMVMLEHYACLTLALTWLPSVCKTVVVVLTTMPTHIHASYGLRVVAVLATPIAGDILLRRPLGSSLQGRCRRLH